MSFWEDLRKLLSAPTLFRLDAIIADRLVPIVYAFGLAAIALWAIWHLVDSFAYNFGQGLWGVVEILVYGPLYWLGLRIVCELVLVYLKANAPAVAAAGSARRSTSLTDEVADAIHDLASDDQVPPNSLS